MRKSMRDASVILTPRTPGVDDDSDKPATVRARRRVKNVDRLGETVSGTGVQLMCNTDGVTTATNYSEGEALKFRSNVDRGSYRQAPSGFKRRQRDGLKETGDNNTHNFLRESFARQLHNADSHRIESELSAPVIQSARNAPNSPLRRTRRLETERNRGSRRGLSDAGAGGKKPHTQGHAHAHARTSPQASPRAWQQRREREFSGKGGSDFNGYHMYKESIIQDDLTNSFSDTVKVQPAIYDGSCDRDEHSQGSSFESGGGSPPAEAPEQPTSNSYAYSNGVWEGIGGGKGKIAKESVPPVRSDERTSGEHKEQRADFVSSSTPQGQHSTPHVPNSKHAKSIEMMNIRDLRQELENLQRQLTAQREIHKDQLERMDEVQEDEIQKLQQAYVHSPENPQLKDEFQSKQRALRRRHRNDVGELDDLNESVVSNLEELLSQVQGRLDRLTRPLEREKPSRVDPFENSAFGRSKAKESSEHTKKPFGYRPRSHQPAREFDQGMPANKNNSGGGVAPLSARREKMATLSQKNPLSSRRQPDVPCPRRDGLVSQLKICKPWIDPALFQGRDYEDLKATFSVDGAGDLPSKETQLETEKIRKNVCPLLYKPKESKEDFQLAMCARFFNQDSDYLRERFQRRSFYDRLGVKPTASSGEIKKAFMKSALFWHPDNIRKTFKYCFANELAYVELVKDIFTHIDEAYRTLTDKGSRYMYDSKRR